eukprot:5142375-Pleurochrysis_carterae.AAC.1
MSPEYTALTKNHLVNSQHQAHERRFAWRREQTGRLREALDTRVHRCEHAQRMHETAGLDARLKPRGAIALELGSIMIMWSPNDEVVTYDQTYMRSLPSEYDAAAWHFGQSHFSKTRE